VNMPGEDPGRTGGMDIDPLLWEGAWPGQARQRAHGGGKQPVPAGTAGIAGHCCRAMRLCFCSQVLGVLA